MPHRFSLTAPFRADDDEPDVHEEPTAPLPPNSPLADRLARQFLEHRKVFLWGAVHDKSAREIVDRLLFLESHEPGKEITFFINSPGGVVSAGMVIYDVMRAISSPVATVCMGLAASMGSILLCAGERGKRRIFPHGEVMIHQPSLGGVFQGAVSDITIQAEQIRKTKQLGAEILAKHCGKSVAEIMHDFDRDFWLDAKAAVAYGIVDEIQEKL